MKGQLLKRQSLTFCEKGACINHLDGRAERGVLLTRIHGPRMARLQALCAGSHVKKRDLIRGTVRHFIGSFTLGV